MEQILLHLEHILFFFYDIYFQRYYQKTIGILILVDEHNQAVKNDRNYKKIFDFFRELKKQRKDMALYIVTHNLFSK